MRYDWQLLRAGTIALDGGGMFGVVPRVLWEKALPPDDKNRVTLAHNCLLLRSEDGRRTVLIETGSGDKFGEKDRRIFGLGDESIHTELGRIGVGHDEVSDVVVTHLHFDHAGGLTRLDEGGEGVAVAAFPGARVHVQKREWQDARQNRSVMSKTYLPENLEPIHDQLALADGDGERLPGLRAFLVPGHTWGQQAVSFDDVNGRSVVFVPDVMPTVHHVGRAYSLAYDVEPYTTTRTKKALLADAVEFGLTLVLSHEPNTPVVTVADDGKGWYELRPI